MNVLTDILPNILTDILEHGTLGLRVIIDLRPSVPLYHGTCTMVLEKETSQ